MKNLTYSEALMRINELERIVKKLQNSSTVINEVSHYSAIKNLATLKFEEQFKDISTGRVYY